MAFRPTLRKLDMVAASGKTARPVHDHCVDYKRTPGCRDTAAASKR